MPALGGEPFYEFWTTDQPVTYDTHGSITSAHGGDILFGAFHVDEVPGVGLDSLTYDAYIRLFDLVDGKGYGNLLRVWHYFPNITADDHGLERYRHFSVGRHEAFAVRRRGVAQAPAACALGSQGGPLLIYFLASRGAGVPVENPRQMSAYRYPQQYGPRSPTFSRATLASPGGQALLFVSGTASIVGHESMHVGDPAAQTREAISNVRALLGRAAAAGFTPARDGLQFKVYVRHAEHFPVVRDCVAEALGSGTRAVYLQADICRQELLVEIEGVCVSAEVSEARSVQRSTKAPEARMAE
jgi:enamine deaminase RidA (YjgF/YER057c/UK114 family)